MREIKTVALIGLGAIGSYLAAGLCPVLGDNLRVIAGGERKERLEQEGMWVNDKLFRFHVVDPSERMEPADLVIVIPKMTGLAAALEDVRNQMGPDSILMLPLNGVESEEAAAKVYGWDRILYSLMRVSSQKEGNRVSFDTGQATVEYGERINRELSPRVLRVKALFDQAGFHSVIQEDMVKAIWQKFVCNVSENQVSAVLGIPFGAWGSSDHANTLRVLVAKEVIDIARKKGIMIDEDYAVNRLGYLNKIKKGNKASTLQDLEQGRKTEVETFAGAVIRLGKETGVATPFNEFLYHGIRVLEEKNQGLIAGM